MQIEAARLQPIVASLFSAMVEHARHSPVFGHIEEKHSSDMLVRYNGVTVFVFCPVEYSCDHAKLLTQTATRKCYIFPLDFETELNSIRAKQAEKKQQSMALVAAACQKTFSFSDPSKMSLEDGAVYILQNANTTPHRCLGLPSDATAEAIRSRYKSLVLRYHPDKCSLSLASRVFDVLRTVYSQISR